MGSPHAGVLSGPRNIIKKVSQTIKYRDNSEDDVRYDPLEDEKSLLEQHESQSLGDERTRKRLLLISSSLILVLLAISVVLNVLSWQKLYVLQQSSHSHGVEIFGIKDFTSP
jgi:predicted nucleic acid-binding Zn ribbon protein